MSSDPKNRFAELLANKTVAVVVLVGLEILVIAILTAVHITGTPAVITVIVFALLERIIYITWRKRQSN